MLFRSGPSNYQSSPPTYMPSFFRRYLLHIIHQISHLRNLLQEYRNPQPPSHHSHNLNYLHFCYINNNCFPHFDTFFESHTRTELFPFYKKPDRYSNHSSFSNILLINFCIRKSPIIILIIIIIIVTSHP